MTLPDLIARVESAPPEMERELLEEGFDVLRPEASTQWREWPPERLIKQDAADIAEFEAWLEWKRVRKDFTTKLDAGAGLCAAMMLLTPGCGYSIKRGADELPEFITHADLPKSAEIFFLSKGIKVFGIAQTEALALLAARLKQEMPS